MFATAKELEMNERRSDRIFTGLGVGYVALTLAGVVFASSIHGGSLSDSDAKIAVQIAHPVSSSNWVGLYLEMLAVGCFLAFAGWATRKLGEGVLAQIARAIAGAWAAVTVASLGLMGGIAYTEGRGLTVPVDRALDAVNKGMYIGTWFLGAFFLLAVGAQAVKVARRRLGWSAIAVAVISLAATPSIDSFGELSVFLFFIWIVAASIALARGRGEPAVVAAVQHAPRFTRSGSAV
jgi:hypothetical protein